MIWDKELFWELRSTKSVQKLLYEHKQLPGVYRVIDVINQTVRFSDIDRIKDIRDINKIITKEDDREKNMERYLGIANDVLDEIEEITFPYDRHKYTAYIEAFPGFSENTDDCVGILYFHDHDKDDMIAAKKFFRILPVISTCSYEEIDFNTYNEAMQKYYRRSKKNVDKVTK